MAARKAGAAIAWPALLLAGLAGCGSTEGEAPGDVTASEAKALEEAAEMLDEQRLPTQAADESSTPSDTSTEPPAR